MQRDFVSNMRRPVTRVPGDAAPAVRVAVGETAAADAGTARIVTPVQVASTRPDAGAAELPALQQAGLGSAAPPADASNSVTLADRRRQGCANASSRCCVAGPPPPCLFRCCSRIICRSSAPAVAICPDDMLIARTGTKTAPELTGSLRVAGMAMRSKLTGAVAMAHCQRRKPVQKAILS